MKKRCPLVLVLFLFTVQISIAQQDSNVDTSGEKVSSNLIRLKTKRTNNYQNRKPVPIDDIGDPIAPPPTTTSYEAGSTADNFSVSLSGSANYSVPIMLPPGVKDVLPNLGISYSNQTGNGLAGWGWNISGLSTISRISATKFYDNKHDGVDFKDDRFSIDGQRLILKSGTYGANKSVYQTENYSNIKIVAYGTSPYGSTFGPSYFVVFYPDGSRAWYGNSGSSRSKLEWAIFRWQDPQGNHVDYNYQYDNGLLSIKSIKYGGRVGGTSTMNQIDFTYTNRVRPEIVHIGDQTFKRTNLLTRVTVKSNGTQYRKYELKYNLTSLRYQRLVSIQEFNKNNKAFKPIKLNYENTTAGFKQRVVSGDLYPGFDYKKSNLIAGEFDGDGRTDAVFYNTKRKDTVYLHYQLYERDFSLAYPIVTGGFTEIFPSKIINHLGKVLTQQAITSVKETSNSTNSYNSSVKFKNYVKAPSGVYLQYEKVWNAPKYSSEYSCNKTNYYNIPKKYISGDFNGDGLTDVLAIEKKYTSSYCSPRNCDDGRDGIDIEYKKSQKLEKNKKQASNSSRPPKWIDDPSCCDCSSYTNRSTRVHFVDLDRRKTSNFSNIAGNLRKPIGTKDRIDVADVNGDGLQDLLHFQEGKLYVYTLDTNNKLKLLKEESDSNIKLDFPILLGDYNGDGKTDFLIPTDNNSSNWKYFISKGDNFYKQIKNLGFPYIKSYLKSSLGWLTTFNINGVRMKRPWFDYRYTPMDANGDGKTDIVIHNVIAPYSSYDRSVEYIKVYKNNQNLSDPTPSFSLEAQHTLNNGGVNKFGNPIVLEANRTNGNLEYGYVSVNNIFMFEFNKDNRQDVTLKSINNNGIITKIDYERLGSVDDQYRYQYQIYTPQYSYEYPFVNINRSPSFRVVKKVTETSPGIIRYQDFMYHGAVSNVNLGFLGFVKTKRSNWYGNGVSKLWTITKQDPNLRGATINQWVSTSSYEGSNYMSKSTNTYSSNLATDKVWTLLPTKVEQHDALTGVNTIRNITYDAYKNPSEEHTTFNGGSKLINYTYTNNISATNQTYHAGRLTKKVETNTIGTNSFTTEEEFLYNNNLVTQQKVRGNGTSWNTEAFLYDAHGNVKRKTLSASGITSRTENFKYDNTGRFLIESTDIEGLKTKFTYDTFGNPLSTTNPYNQTTTLTYDGWNRLKTEKDYLGHTTLFSYTRLGNGGLKKKSNFPKGTDEEVEYNALGWITKSSVLGLNNKWTRKSFQYDVAGRRIKKSEPYFSYPSQWNTVAYDNYGRQVARTSFNGLVANITYSGLTSIVDDGTKTVKTTKDGGGNIVKMEDPGGTITYQYYGNGTMKSANYGSHVVSTEIDGWGRKTKLTDPSAGTYTYNYNNIGELLEETTPKGATNYTYDAYGKINTKVLSGDETNMSLSYTYDSSTKLLKSIQGNNGRTSESYTYEYVYDSQKRPYITKETNGKAYFEHKVTRDTYGRVDSETYTSRSNVGNVSSTVKVKNVYDKDAGILHEIRDFSSKALLWKLKEVSERGQAKEVELGNGIIKKKTYDQFGFITKILDQKGTTTTALNLEYAFDATRGNLNSRKNNNFSWNENFTYDNLDRLTNISGAVTRNQEYDNRGRITKNSTVGDYVYTTANSYRLKEVDLNTQGDFHYRNNPIQNVKYNAYKKPVSITSQDNGRVDFEYGLLQNRSHAYYGGEQEDKLQRRFQKHYSAITPVEIEVDNQGNTKIITYIGGDAYSAPVTHIKQTASGSANGYHYLHRDYLSSILAISDSSGAISEQRQFGAWGTIDRYKTGASEIDFAHDSTLINRGYTGHEHFLEVGLIHMNGRMYDANLGRFLSPDNFVQEPYSTQSFNRFGYVWNNPLKHVDPSGEFIFSALIGALIGVVVNGISNSIQGKPFFRGAGLAALTGAIGGAAAFGIGEITSGLSGLLKAGVQAFMHGHLGGMMSAVMGGDYLTGFAGGAIGSLAASGAGKVFKGAKEFWKKAGTVLSGSLSGGVGSVIAGGKFWDGFRNGAISSTLNHIAHMVKSKIDIERIIKKYEANEKKMIDNTIKMDILKNFTKWGQREKGLETAIQKTVAEWRDMGAETSSSDQIWSDINDAMLALGVTATSKVPQIKIAAGILSARYGAENFYLQAVNNSTYKPLIVRYAPNYARINGLMTYEQLQNYYKQCNCGGGFGGGGATGGW